MKKLAIVSSHPIQYNAPWFALLNESNIVKPKIFYTWQQSQNDKYDPGFQKVIKWDVPLLIGYEYTFVNNISKDPGTHHFKGLVNPTLNSEIFEWQPDAILVFGWSFDSHLKCIRHFHKKIPILFRGDSTLLDEQGGIKTFLRRLFLKWVYINIDFALYVGSNNKAYFLKHSVKEHQLAYVPHAVDNNRFAEPAHLYEEKALVLKEQLGIHSQDVVLLFAGKLESKKNPFFLLQLVKKISDPRLKIIFVGDGLLKAPLQKDAAEYGNRVHFLDFQNQQEMPVIYRIADMLVLPSKGPGETWGLALNEAMGCEKAVVASDKAGGAADLIKPGINGLIIRNNDTEELEALLKRALRSKEELNTMGKMSKQIIDQFSYQHIIEAICGLMKMIN